MKQPDYILLSENISIFFQSDNKLCWTFYVPGNVPDAGFIAIKKKKDRVSVFPMDKMDHVQENK